MHNPFDIVKIRADFPILHTTIKNKPLIYLDNAASCQKPAVVIEAIKDFYLAHYSNVHRGSYTLSEQATDWFEESRRKVQRFIGATLPEEIVFTHGTTEAINLVAHSYLRARLQAGDEILLSHMEHHANIIPWKALCDETGARLVIVPLTSTGELNLSELLNLLNSKTRLVAITHLSNVLGVLNPLKLIIEQAHQYDVPVLVDGAQAVSHMRVDMQALDCDFYTFSGHKLYGPNSIGVLYGKMKYLESMRPWQGGGGMINRVRFEHIDFREPPYRFEAGTPPIAEAIGLGATLDYLNQLDWEALMQHEKTLFTCLEQGLSTIPQVKCLSTAPNRMSIISFVIEGIHAHDVATVLNEEGIAVRAGHHCAMPLMDALQVPAATRISLGMYNTLEEVNAVIMGIPKVLHLLK
jgi:cysteine desulfurase/selenocysteine lyase